MMGESAEIHPKGGEHSPLGLGDFFFSPDDPLHPDYQDDDSDLDDPDLDDSDLDDEI